jgi:hypothetical protein
MVGSKMGLGPDPITAQPGALGVELKAQTGAEYLC